MSILLGRICDLIPFLQPTDLASVEADVDEGSLRYHNAFKHLELGAFAPGAGRKAGFLTE
jgi:hypothetical protein